MKSRLTGLSNLEVEARLAEYGRNDIDSKKNYWWEILFRQINSPFIYLLLAAGVIALALRQPFDAAMILFFVLINTSLSFYQEFRSERALKLLQQYMVNRVKVMRQGQEQTIDVRDLAPGDIAVLDTGDYIPADFRLLEADNLMVDESIISGESTAVDKDSKILKNQPKNIYQSVNLLFSGTTVVKGRGLSLTLATGDRTSLGKIAHLTSETVKESVFSKNIFRFSKFIIRLVVLTLIFIFLVNVGLKGGEAEIGNLLIFSIALAISVIPEALPVVITLSLSRGALRLARKKVVVKRLSAIEDLGGIDILCTDKTGTLTENSLSVAEIFSGSLPQTILYANLAAAVEKKKMEPFDVAVFDKLTRPDQEKISAYKIFREIPFDPTNRWNSVIGRSKSSLEIIVRGATEAVIKNCDNLSPKKFQAISAWLVQQGQSGQRVLAVARRQLAGNKLPQDDELIKNLQFIGAIAFTDPIKKSAFLAVAQAKKLGLDLKILTGDSLEVASYVAEKIGLAAKAKVISGEKFFNLPIEERPEAVKRYAVFARVTPEQKFNILKLLQAGHEVGFLGEGINDAPALKASGVSLVVDSAAHVARGAADIILLQKDLRVIIDGIQEGRRVFANTIKYIKATMASNFGNFYAVALASLLVNYLPMLPIQILLLNLISDFPMIAIATDRIDKNEVARPQKYNLKEIVVISTIFGLISTIFDFMFFAIFSRVSPPVLQTSWFIGSILTELVFLFSVRSKKFALWTTPTTLMIAILTSAAALAAIILPLSGFGQKFLHFVPLKINYFLIIFGLVGLYFFTTELAKVIYYRYFSKKFSEN
ncbi:MAG: hypothetical protein A3D39_05555 [Candidatus Buchananbacteria bacterium RIFCSPHIGHO2_02_FULL_39_17]|nr:MAG: hypothetical protein A3D39_05555 [Candidatus Buchananbacteria bacterium RIFCSPHIGHO2_02_FULL_39_17]